ncbi:MAG: helix-turn-helix domain-containing protein [Hyphomicrobium sp.]
MARPGRLNERAAPGRPGAALWHVDAGWAIFAGPLQHNDSHAHSTAVYLAGLYGTFRLRVAGAGWLSCRSAVIRAGTPYEFDVGGEPLGVFYLEPNLAGADALASLIEGGNDVNGALIGGGDGALLRAQYELRPEADDLRARMLDIVDFATRKARRLMDARVARAVEDLQVHASDAVSAADAAARAGLSASRFQHLFTAEVGVPFRRYRSWHRVRMAIREVIGGSNYTAAAHAAGFADQAHFTREFRRTFGAPPSRGL